MNPTMTSTERRTLKKTITTHAHPRIGLLGNPSDLYGGRVLGFTFSGFMAQVHLDPCDGIELHGSDETLRCSVQSPLAAELSARTGSGGSELLAAAVKRLVAARPELETETRGFSMRFETDIPRQAGLSGSSGIIVAALRALGRHFGADLGPEALALLAQEAETEELGLVAGPQDRVLQAHRGLLSMDFSGSKPVVQRLEPDLLPPLLLAWDPEPGQPSGEVHARVLARWEAGDELVREVMRELPELVAEGVAALQAGDQSRLVALMDRNFELRRSVFDIAPRDQELVTLGRDYGAGAKLCGSGGSAVFMHTDPGALSRLAQVLSQAGWSSLFPQVVGDES